MEARNVCRALAILAIAVTRIEPSTDAMKYINSGFVKVLDQCRRELNLSENIFADLFHFWKLEYDLLNRNTGCIIICMSKKLDLIDGNGKLHHGNAHDFAMKHGAGEELSNTLVTSLHTCEKQSEANQDDCLRVLEMAKCFRSAINELGWAPKMEIMVEEVLTEV